MCRGIEQLRSNVRSGARLAYRNIFANFIEHRPEQRSHFSIKHAELPKLRGY